MTTQIRVSDDVITLARHVAKAKGLSSERIAIEAIVRTCWKHYLEGACSPGDSEDLEDLEDEPLRKKSTSIVDSTEFNGIGELEEACRLMLT